MALDEEFPEDSIVGKMLRQQRAAEAKAAQKKVKAATRRGTYGLAEIDKMDTATAVLQRRMREAGAD